MTEHLSDQQLARLEALKASAALASTNGGPFGPRTPPGVPEIVDLAEYVIAGVHPRDRYNEDSPSAEQALRDSADRIDAVADTVGMALAILRDRADELGLKDKT